jgi:hypothetical protein
MEQAGSLNGLNHDSSASPDCRKIFFCAVFRDKHDKYLMTTSSFIHPFTQETHEARIT